MDIKLPSVGPLPPFLLWPLGSSHRSGQRSSGQRKRTTAIMWNKNHLLLVTMVTSVVASAALGETESTLSNSQESSLDYVYPKYAIQYLGLEGYKSQSTSNNPVIYMGPDQQGFAKYITYTNDGANVYEVTVQVKPGTYPVIWSTPVQSTLSAANAVKVDNGGESDTQNNAAHSRPPGNDQFSEDPIPMTLPSQTEEQLPEMTTCHNGIPDENSTEQPRSVVSKDGNKNAAGNSDRKDTSSNATPVGSGQNKNHHMPLPGTRTQYFPSLYGAMSFYPVAYNPFTGQVKYAARPLGSMTNAKLPPTVSTGMAQGEKTAQTISTTLKPFAMTSRPSSSIPVAITTSPIRVKPVPYAYPYVSYQSQNSRIIYQVPAQQMPSQAIQWVQALPVARYPTTYPQGYYQPAVLTLKAQQPPSAAMKLSATPTVHTSEAAIQT